MSIYAALAEPHRRQIPDLLRDGERHAGELVERLELSQPGAPGRPRQQHLGENP